MFLFSQKHGRRTTPPTGHSATRTHCHPCRPRHIQKSVYFIPHREPTHGLWIYMNTEWCANAGTITKHRLNSWQFSADLIIFCRRSVSLLVWRCIFKMMLFYTCISILVYFCPTCTYLQIIMALITVRCLLLSTEYSFIVYYSHQLVSHFSVVV